MELNRELCRIRNVRKTLYRQPNMKEFHAELKRQEGEAVRDEERTPK